MTKSSPLLVKHVLKDVFFRCDEINNPILHDSLAKLTKDEQKAKELIGLVKKGFDYASSEYDNVPVNMCRIKLNGYDASYMEYDNLMNPHPELKRSIRVNFSQDGDIEVAKLRKEKNNPPILHRMELYYLPGTPEYDMHKQITEKEESLGVFDVENKRKIGRKKGMENVIS